MWVVAEHEPAGTLTILQSSARAVGRVVRAAAFEAVHRYHGLLPGFVELYAGAPKKLGPVFAKDAWFLFALTRLLMPKSIIEIGVGLAASDVAFAEALRQNHRGHLVAVDVSQFSIDRSRRLLGYHGLRPFVTFFKGDSRHIATRDQVAAMAGSAEMLFIDGDHSFEGARADFELYSPLVADGGVIVFHDVGSFPSDDTALLDRVRAVSPDERLVPNADGTGVYHRPGCAQAVDWIVAHDARYALLFLHTLAEPCCGIAILQKKANVFVPKTEDARLGAASTEGAL
jgi:predicted O-methyltransferase YrrM